MDGVRRWQHKRSLQTMQLTVHGFFNPLHKIRIDLYQISCAVHNLKLDTYLHFTALHQCTNAGCRIRIDISITFPRYSLNRHFLLFTIFTLLVSNFHFIQLIILLMCDLRWHEVVIWPIEIDLLPLDGHNFVLSAGCNVFNKQR